jgi:hypothetical protein
MILSELDSVPGGFGLTHLLNRAYSKIGYAPVGGPDGMTGGFRHLIRDLTADAASPSEIRLALVISRESSDYFDEMKAFARELNGPGFSVIACHPEELHYTEDGVYRKEEEELLPLGSVYRFLELFDYKNIPKMDLLLYSSRKRKVAVTPPFKAYLEEKLWFALFHHPVLKGFWEAALGEETHAFLSSRIPRTWILDPRPLPPHGIIPGLTFRGKPVTRFEELREAGQSERTYVIKPSGFSDLAWGARGVSIGPDLSREEWSARLDSALGNFSATPSLLQEYHPARRVEIGFLDSVSDVVKHLSGRARLCPYYFTSREETVLGGVLATICPADKKIIHGMSDAVMAPCRLA